MAQFSKTALPDVTQALSGRDQVMPVPASHFVNHHPLQAPFPEGLSLIYFGLGCFWGAERLFWQQDGVYTTAVGYAGGLTPNPTYEELCSGGTGHAEVVMVVYDSAVITTEMLLKLFWESHDPTQGMKQGNDVGTQYRSVIFTSVAEQALAAEASRTDYQQALKEKGFGGVTTETGAAPTFYYAEEYHQQYLAKNPGGYCGMGGTGICLPPSQKQKLQK